MFSTSLYYGHWDYWNLQHKVSFDGINKLITINVDETDINVRINIYSDWKEWVKLRDNAKYLPAIRTIGGDTIDIVKGKYAGDIYFLINGWKVVIPHAVKLTGILYSDDGSSPYIVLAGGGVQAEVSNLAQSIEVPNLYTPQAIRMEMDSASTKLIDTINRLSNLSTQITAVPQAVWDEPTTNPTAGSMKEFITKKLLTIAKYIGLK